MIRIDSEEHASSVIRELMSSSLSQKRYQTNNDKMTTNLKDFNTVVKKTEKLIPGISTIVVSESAVNVKQVSRSISNEAVSAIAMKLRECSIDDISSGDENFCSEFSTAKTHTRIIASNNLYSKGGNRDECGIDSDEDDYRELFAGFVAPRGTGSVATSALRNSALLSSSSYPMRRKQGSAPPATGSAPSSDVDSTTAFLESKINASRVIIKAGQRIIVRPGKR